MKFASVVGFGSASEGFIQRAVKFPVLRKLRIFICPCTYLVLTSGNPCNKFVKDCLVGAIFEGLYKNIVVFVQLDVVIVGQDRPHVFLRDSVEVHEVAWLLGAFEHAHRDVLGQLFRRFTENKEVQKGSKRVGIDIWTDIHRIFVDELWRDEGVVVWVLFRFGSSGF